MEILRLEKINVTYPDGTQALKEIDLSIEQGEILFVCGLTGSGKSTLLQEIKHRAKEEAGYVMQNPDSQIVHDKVSEELAFQLRNLGYTQSEINRRVAETASYFGISRWLWRDTANLSGGEKQMLNLAAAMAVHPKILILDEPAAMLDPVMRSRFMAVVMDLNREYGTTIVITEHRTDELFPEASRVLVLKEGSIFCLEHPKDAVMRMFQDSKLRSLLPGITQMFQGDKNPPLTVSEARELIYHKNPQVASSQKVPPKEREALTLEHIRFSYEKNMAPVLMDLTFSVREGEIFSVLGENGSGKSTLGKIAMGALKAYEGKIRIFGKKPGKATEQVAMLFQDVTCHFLEDQCHGLFEGRHPYDLSGGERQRYALELVLAGKPNILILDEPAKGLDDYEKLLFIKELLDLKKKGMTILMITHDVELAAAVSDRMGLIFNGTMAMSETPEVFCSENLFYTTPMARVFRDQNPGILTIMDIQGLG